MMASPQSRVKASCKNADPLRSIVGSSQSSDNIHTAYFPYFHTSHKDCEFCWMGTLVQADLLMLNFLTLLLLTIVGDYFFSQLREAELALWSGLLLFFHQNLFSPSFISIIYCNFLALFNNPEMTAMVYEVYRPANSP